MDSMIDFQRLSYLSCAVHSKRIQFFCTAEKCEKILICGECLIDEKEHVKHHLDGFCSVEDYKNKIITNLFKKFDEAMLKVENKKDMLSNDIEEVGSYFDFEISKIQRKTIDSVNNFFDNLKVKLKSMVEKKYSNFMKALNDLHLEIELTRYGFYCGYRYWFGIRLNKKEELEKVPR